MQNPSQGPTGLEHQDEQTRIDDGVLYVKPLQSKIGGKMSVSSFLNSLGVESITQMKQTRKSSPEIKIIHGIAVSTLDNDGSLPSPTGMPPATSRLLS